MQRECNAMAFLTLAEAALLVGVNKATLWRAIKQGRLSAQRQEDRSYRVEESELLRVFPDIRNPHTGQESTVIMPLHATLQIDALKAQVDLLHQRIDALQRDKQWLMQRIEALETTQRALLPAPQKSWLDRLAEALAKLKKPPG
jgi:excisionase family DNA binding protein